MMGDFTTQAKRYLDPRLILMIGLGASCGLPFLLVFSTLSVWLREAGLERSEIGLLSWVGMAYTLKFLWAPVLDNWRVPLLEPIVGRIRSWMILAQLTVAAGLFGIASGDPGQSVWAIAAWALVVAFGSATQDIAVDAWRIRSAPGSEQGNMAAAYQLGYRAGLIAAGAGVLYLADLWSFPVAYSVMAAMMSIGILCALLGVEAVSEGDGPQVQRNLKTALLDLFRRKGATILLVLAVIALYRIPDFVGGVMANTLYVDLGFTKTEIANVTKVYGMVIGLAGALVAGVAVARFGLIRPLAVGAVIAGGSNLMLGWLAMAGHDYGLFVWTVSIENFSGGFAGTVLIAFMSAQVSLAFAATQYALLSSFFALPGKFIGGFAGMVVDAAGYPAFYAATALMGIPALLLCAFLPRTREEPAAVAAPLSQTRTVRRCRKGFTAQRIAFSVGRHCCWGRLCASHACLSFSCGAERR
jgi:PAT family beta-lactamase induction signal transducer AmpG